MKQDEARKWTDKHLKEMERKITKEYSQAKDELTEKFREYMHRQQAYISDLQNEYNEMKRIGATAEAREIGKQLGIEKQKLTLRNDKYQSMIDETTTRLANANQIAVLYLNGEMPSIYSVNYNELGKDVKDLGIRFDMIDEHTVARRIKDGDIKLPKKKINVPKDKKWNTKRLNSSVLHGILQGESMDKIANRIYPIVDNNKSAAIRNARTMVTGAENRGRLDSYKEAQDIGISMKKTWVATMDERTRESHIEIDGETANIDEPFSNGLMYPGDPNGVPEEVYNCRCTMVSEIDGFNTSTGFSPIDMSSTSGKVLNGAKSAEKKITSDLKSSLNKSTGHLEGLDSRFKEKESLERKIINKANSKHTTREKCAKQITDALRYTNVSTPENLTNDFNIITKNLSKKGYNMIEVSNTIWDINAEYRGVNTLVESPKGYTFELQFHTPESLEIKEINHKLYEKQKLANTTEAEKIKLGEEMIRNAKSIKIPVNSKNIVNKGIDKKISQW